ncbi:MAG TPA: ABC transporter permease subunit [bacterium]|nr:ABC transporter permease subunit [bacterium]HMW32112.1 ABC transporter permease subunit [bacterium]HMY37134.1 ABC transporter permease subunit [bacterium]HMZ05805.1 ABC transporter permease subunit [bacterium]HNB08553.1 ABC transporter permease subunit [bacterium]
MLSLLIIKEFKNILQSPKFIATFISCTLLIILSVWVGIREYKLAVKDYETGIALNRQDLSERTNWMNVGNRVYRKPDPMQIWTFGVHYDIGRVAHVNTWDSPELRSSIYSRDLVYAVFRFLDFNFIVVVVLSLFAIVFTYDAVSGEKESGMLKLTFSNGVPKSTYIVAKIIGSWAGLGIPLIVPMLLSFLMTILFQIPLTPDHYARLGGLILAGALYFTFFIILGILISSWTSHSNASFLTLLVLWVTITFVVPRLGVMLSGQVLPVPTAAEVDSQIEGFSKSQFETLRQNLSETWMKRNNDVQQQPESERQTYRDKMEWTWLEEDQNARKSVQENIESFTRKVHEDMDNRKREQIKLGLIFARWSPTSLFQLAAMRFSQTDIFLKERYDDAIRTYQKDFSDVVEKKRRENRAEGLRIEVDSDRGFRVQTPDLKKTIDVRSIPEFTHPAVSAGHAWRLSVWDIVLLAVITGFVFLGALVRFLRYDVR